MQTNVTPNSAEDIDALLLQLQIVEEDENVEIGATTDSSDDTIKSVKVLDEGELLDLDLEELKRHAYDSQESKIDSSGAEDAVVIEEVPKKRRGRKPKTQATSVAPSNVKVVSKQRAPRASMSNLPDNIFILEDEDQDTAKAYAMANVPGQVKVAEKFENLFHSIHLGKLPSRYVMIALDVLIKNKCASSTDIRNTMVAEGIGETTAASQTGQIMVLLPATKMVIRTRQLLKLNENSALIKKITAIKESLSKSGE